MNKGEGAELFLKADLLRLKDSGESHPVLGKILQLSDGKDLENLKWKPQCQSLLDSQEFEDLQECLGLKKSPSRSKTDVTINNVKYSVKLKNEKPSIINHTSRPGFERICTSLGIKIETLDQIIDEYWRRRKKEIITEDIGNDDSRSPFLSHKEDLRPIINYFIFSGTGSADSDYPAEKVLVIDYKLLQTGITVYDKDKYFDHVWPKLVFSLRGGGKAKRGMPKDYPNCEDSESIGRWTKKTSDGYKGALSVRVR